MSEKHRTFNVLNILLKFHAFPSETMDKFCMVECLVPPGAGAPPNHHAGETESYFIIEGEVGFMVDGKEFVAKPGDNVIVPDGAVHAFSAIGDRPARIMIIDAPGTMHEQFFTEIGTELPEGQTDMPEPSEPNIPVVLAAAEACGMSIVGP